MLKGRWLACGTAAALALVAHGARADEGGAGFWLPGQMGSFSALPSDPGWSIPVVYYHASSDAGGGKAFEIGGQVRVNLNAKADLLLAVPTYVFSSPVAGAQASLSMTGVLGRVAVDVGATLTGPGGGTISGTHGDTAQGLGDLFPMASLKWSDGVHHVMAYTMAGVPVGTYQANRLANVGANHWALDGGGGYTYLDQKAGREFTAVLGLTYNFENPDTHYKNGIDGHLDWAASQFLSEQWHVGAVGYFYQQLTGDSGSGATLGEFKSRVYAVGPQAGYFFKVAGRQWYANVKGFYEFDAKNRPQGWNTWLTLSIPLSGDPSKH